MQDSIEISVDPTEAGNGLRGHRTLASAIFSHVRDDIVSCRIKPGEKLVVSALSNRFNVSFAAVREALSRLVAVGLVVAEDQRGFRASPLSVDDLMDLTYTRIEIECLALRRSIANGDAAWKESVTAAWRSLQAVPRTPAHDPGQHNPQWSAMHSEFHSAIVAACGLKWLLEFRDKLYVQSERYRQMAVALKPTGRNVQEEHRIIVEATLDGDSDAAANEMARHIERTATAIAEVYE